MEESIASQPIASVIIPTHNRENLIVRAVQSVLDQTIPDFELLIIDDGSTDATEAVIASMSDKRICYLRHPESRGPSAARNTGIKASAGRYIAFLDSDDTWYPDKLMKQLSAFDANPGAGLVYTGATRINDTSTEHLLPRYRGNLIDHLLLSNVVGSPTAVMISRTVVEKTGLFDEQLKGREDLDYWLRIALDFEIDFVNEELVCLHTAAQNRVSYNDRIVDAYRYFFRKHRMLLKQRRCSTEHVRRGAKFIYTFTKNRRLALQHLTLALQESPFDPAAWINYVRYAIKWS